MIFCTKSLKLYVSYTLAAFQKVSSHISVQQPPFHIVQLLWIKYWRFFPYWIIGVWVWHGSLFYWSMQFKCTVNTHWNESAHFFRCENSCFSFWIFQVSNTVTNLPHNYSHSVSPLGSTKFPSRSTSCNYHASPSPGSFHPHTPFPSSLSLCNMLLWGFWRGPSLFPEIGNQIP